MSRKTWRERFDDPRPVEVKAAPRDFADIRAGQKMLLTTPRDMARCLARVPRGEEVGMTELRERLAGAHRAEIACPVVTGIHLRTVAEYVGQCLDAGRSPAELPPVWRAMPAGAPIWRKLEHGADALRNLRALEGLTN